jgi:hypothetical protein
MAGFSLKLDREVENHSEETKCHSEETKSHSEEPFDVVGRMKNNHKNADIPLMYH